MILLFNWVISNVHVSFRRVVGHEFELFCSNIFMHIHTNMYVRKILKPM